MNELLPCPFCGGTARKVCSDVECMSCAALMPGGDGLPDPAEGWNQRRQPTGPPAIRKPVVYIASPYTKGDPCINTWWQVQVFNCLLNEGRVTPVAPLISHFLHTMHPRSYEDWIRYDLEILHTCDALVRLDARHDGLGYWEEDSPGADNEVEYMKKLGRPVFFSIEDLYEWADAREEERWTSAFKS